MGNDGGSIPRRIELVKEKQKEVKINPDLERVAAWFYCALSKQPLQPPIVACGLGKLYNQDAILEYILDKNAYGDGDKICSHITSPKDTVKLNLAPNPAYDEAKNAQDSTTMGHLDKDIKSRFICPVSMKEMNGKHRFVYLDTCGCTFAEQSLKEIKTQECVSCGKPFTQDNVVVINPHKEELDRMKTILKEKKAKAKAERKAKKAAAKEAGVPIEKKRKREADKSVSPPIPTGSPAQKKLQMNSTAAAVMGKVSQELAEKEKNKKEASSAIKSIYAKKDIKGNYLTMGTFNRYA
ncbi:Rtf2 RING-finger-domain-containing protein [Syncephalastrum racemosum]|uniref:Rtf2 RING-finger-domain-containing protein n=1 Tax=Syncephalastrum racemosum TaxID=13706 RepID=A0A1X2H7H5_SYNRA|nr:Rtf2 RING-finger-domain-containing protein [Syncephalastrum racemosum]